jgi:hypothetical protein
LLIATETARLREFRGGRTGSDSRLQPSCSEDGLSRLLKAGIQGLMASNRSLAEQTESPLEPRRIHGVLRRLSERSKKVIVRIIILQSTHANTSSARL